MTLGLTQVADIIKKGLSDSLQATSQKAAVDALNDVVTRGAIQSNPYNWDARNAAMDAVTDVINASKIFSQDEILRIMGMKDFVKAKLTISWMPEGLNGHTFNFTGRDRFVVAGGCFTSILHNKDVNDYDLFLLGYDDDLMKESSFVKQLDDVEQIHRGRFITIDHSDYKMNPNILKTYLDNQTRIQYIFTKYKTRKELVDHFDFVHCCISYDLGEDKLYITKETYDMNVTQKLKKNPTTDRINPRRITKFENKGWTRYYEANTL